jgi:hypothetical protein
LWRLNQPRKRSNLGPETLPLAARMGTFRGAYGRPFGPQDGLFVAVIELPFGVVQRHI